VLGPQALNSLGAKSDQEAGPIKVEVTEPVYVLASEAKVREWLNYYRYERTPPEAQIIESKETAEGTQIFCHNLW
jgi:hypothetical protein